MDNTEKLPIRERKAFQTTFPILCWEDEMLPFPKHWHDCFEILLLSKGGMFVSVDDTLYETFPGDLIMINSGAIHSFLDSRHNTTYQGFQFDITFFDESFIGLRDTIFKNPVLSKKSVHKGVSEQWRNLLCNIAQEYATKQIGYQLAIKTKLYELMLLILRESPDAGSENLPAKSKQLFSFILKNYGDTELSLEGAAFALHINKFYLSHSFKKYSGQSFHAYLTKIRVNFAKQYLSESKMSVTDIAFNSGFNSLQTFNRVFKTQTGFTPSDYRRENAASHPVNTYVNSANSIAK
ncbi:MAG: AraC family transcriptional regulator [Treponemataceae bacterium]|nr:MAG: AraC family transcriptional regulator [Treponemataceae bacterium]